MQFASLSTCFYVLLPNFFLISFSFASEIQVFPPRGVSLTRKIFYDQNKDFTCLDGSKKISFQQVNDDYCDCPDNSDEPGTSACPNGLFHCANAGYRTMNIPSSRVNDGICDCCDGSDEWRSKGLCTNSCVDLWRMEREILKEQQAAANQGYLLRQEYAKSGLQKKQEREERVKEMEAELARLKENEASLLAEKDTLESYEATLKEQHQIKVDAIREEKTKEENVRKGTEAFLEMDTDKDGLVSVAELIVYTELDPNNEDGEFTVEEGKGVLGDDMIDLASFLANTWPSINSMFITKLEMTREEIDQRKEEIDEENLNEEEERAEEEGRSEEDWEEEDYDEEDEDFEEDEQEEEEEQRAASSSNDEEELEYDDATRAAVEEANRVRDQFNDHQQKKKKIEEEISSINNNLGRDYGPDLAFQTLEGQCFELNTLEYKYKFCPFDRTAQQPKNGGSETSLGKWGKWSGVAGNTYASMKYENGLGCWNGPSRSTEVKISCGMEHKVISVDEPSRCAYVFEFTTPCVCNQVNNEAIDNMLRDEL